MALLLQDREGALPGHVHGDALSLLEDQAELLQRLLDLDPVGAAWPRVGLDRLAHPAHGLRRIDESGELLFQWKGKWRIATGDVPDALESPVAGIVRNVQPGTSLTVRATGRAIRGIVTLGGPTRGRLRSASGVSGGLHADSACETCAVWLHENHFPAGMDLSAEQAERNYARFVDR